MLLLGGYFTLLLTKGILLVFYPQLLGKLQVLLSLCQPMIIYWFLIEYLPAPLGILPHLPITLGGETVCTDVMGVQGPLDFNLLLG